MPLTTVKKVRECWVEQDKLDVIARINHHLKGEEVVGILKCFPIGSQCRVTASRLLGTKCSGLTPSAASSSLSATYSANTTLCCSHS